MPKTLINPPHLAPPRGFNHGILASGGQTLFLSGQDASDETGTIVAPGDLVAQYEQVLKNLQGVVEHAARCSHLILQVSVVTFQLLTLLMDALSELSNPRHRADLGAQEAALERLDQVVIATRLNTARESLVVRSRGQEDHRYKAIATDHLNLVSRLVAVHNRHLDIEENEVR